jgi:hypothetical protein
MSSAEPPPLPPKEIARDARWLAQALDPNAGLVRVIEMNRESYRAASFLDDRMLQQPVNAHVVPWQMVASAIPSEARRDARWIFHIGHVGSTLIARLLGEIPGVLSVREPRFLRDLTAVPPDQRQTMSAVAQALFSRTFGLEEVALVKATSLVSEIAPELVPSGERVLFMYATPRSYVASILAGENSVKELRMLSSIRAQRSASRVSGLDRRDASDAHLAAAAWACEMTALEASAERMTDRRADWADFDRMLANMRSELHRVADLFGFPASDEQLQAIASGPLMRRYSKALEYDYSADLRRELIAEAEAHFRRDIDDALAMLREAAEKSPLLARALARATES